MTMWNLRNVFRSTISAKLDVVIKNQKTIIERMRAMGQVLDVIKDFAAKIDAATNLIAARIQKLIDQVTEGTVTPEQVAEALQPEVDKLEAMGKDPENPVPPA